MFTSIFLFEKVQKKVQEVKHSRDCENQNFEDRSEIFEI